MQCKSLVSGGHARLCKIRVLLSKIYDLSSAFAKMAQNFAVLSRGPPLGEIPYAWLKSILKS